jgi:hypothetical protein
MDKQQDPNASILKTLLERAQAHLETEDYEWLMSNLQEAFELANYLRLQAEGEGATDEEESE